ncbi:MAG TPA: hypothetical protein VLA54_09740 [Acidimicrobiia bacterium]|nr:hypothetical protein [Acidimicrobiia bacterium]
MNIEQALCLLTGAGFEFASVFDGPGRTCPDCSCQEHAAAA